MGNWRYLLNRDRTCHRKNYGFAFIYLLMVLLVVSTIIESYFLSRTKADQEFKIKRIAYEIQALADASHNYYSQTLFKFPKQLSDIFNDQYLPKIPIPKRYQISIDSYAMYSISYPFKPTARAGCIFKGNFLPIKANAEGYTPFVQLIVSADFIKSEEAIARTLATYFPDTTFDSSAGCAPDKSSNHSCFQVKFLIFTPQTIIKTIRNESFSKDPVLNPGFESCPGDKYRPGISFAFSSMTGNINFPWKDWKHPDQRAYKVPYGFGITWTKPGPKRDQTLFPRFSYGTAAEGLLNWSPVTALLMPQPSNTAYSDANPWPCKSSGDYYLNCLQDRWENRYKENGLMIFTFCQRPPAEAHDINGKSCAFW